MPETSVLRRVLQPLDQLVGFVLRDLAVLHYLLDGLDFGIKELLVQLIHGKPFFLGDVENLLTLLQFGFKFVGAHTENLGQHI
ncbi:hypothetical protein G7K71_14140 [Desulfofundulus sp. TPOSR]|uniref:hypothetical protein n=1 Tax=Desulfofundulus sp. TPOSR TaxID=2714340 RepID=UPI0014084A38|nr:hypothetical protein [Desulfofundulus sp. TPOSR]NHM28099.1 hypothetical protein [Desulfofundulus sp. TPOSR]